MNRSSQLLLTLFAVFAFGFITGCSQPVSGKQRQADTEVVNLSGIWKTKSPVPMLVEPSNARPHGTKIDHDGVELVERMVQLEFKLVERADGIVHGTNRWVVFDSKGKEIHRGEEPLLGTGQGNRTVLVEPPDETSDSAQLIFEITGREPNRIHGFAYDVGSVRLVALRFELFRQK